MNQLFSRTELLLGSKAMEQLKESAIILFGVGGVGSWCAESLIRSGITQLTLVDFDNVCPSNTNRQVQSTTKTIGKEKALVLEERLREINPEAEITVIVRKFETDNEKSFSLEKYNYIIDAIDLLEQKAHLIKTAIENNYRIFSSMGAALRFDPFRFQSKNLWNISGCPMARRVRKILRKQHVKERQVPCVFSSEVVHNGKKIYDQEAIRTEMKGTIAHATAIAGFSLAGIVISEILEKASLSPVAKDIEF